MRIMIILPGTEATYPTGSLPAVLDARMGVMQESVLPGTEVNVATLPAGSPSMHVPGGTSGHLAMMAAPIVERARQAEAEGYDAIVNYGMFDPGTEAARHFVRIPVIGTGRAGLLAAAALGDRFGGIVYESTHQTVAARMIRSYQMEPNFVSVRPVNIPATEMRARADELFERMVALSRKAIDEEGAQVIVPLGMSMTPAVVQAEDLASEIKAPVVDGLLASVRLAETCVLMKTSHSPLAYPPAG